MSAAPEGPYRSIFHEAHTAWAVGAPASEWRAACALGFLLAEEGGEGDAGPALHVALMTARLLKADPARVHGSLPLARRISTPYVSAVAVLTLAGDDDNVSALVAVASPGRVAVCSLGGDGDGRDARAGDDGSMCEVVLDGLHPVALVPIAACDCLVLCRTGALIHVRVSADGPQCVSATHEQLPPLPLAAPERHWWSAVMPWPHEVLLFNDSATVHTVKLLAAVSEPHSEPGAILAAAPAAAWQRGAACTEGLWCAADSRAECDFRVFIVDERQRQIQSTTPSTASTDSDTSIASSAASGQGCLLVTLVTFKAVEEVPTFDFSRDPRRSELDVSVRIVHIVPPPTLSVSRRPNAPELGALLEGVTSMVTSGDGGTATLVLASALAPELVLLTLSLRAHEEQYYNERQHGPAADPHNGDMAAADDDDDADPAVHNDVAPELRRRLVGEGAIATVPLPSASASFASATTWIAPHLRHPQWTPTREWSRSMPPLDQTAHVTAVNVASSSFDVVMHRVAAA
jgi:hypothetical protein